MEAGQYLWFILPLTRVSPHRVGLWRSWERASMAWKRSSVRTRPGPPNSSNGPDEKTTHILNSRAGSRPPTGRIRSFADDVNHRGTTVWPCFSFAACSATRSLLAHFRTCLTFPVPPGDASSFVCATDLLARTPAATTEFARAEGSGNISSTMPAANPAVASR